MPMHLLLNFDGNSEIGVYLRITNKYIIVGRTESTTVVEFLQEHFDCPIIETTINHIRTVGSLCVGNSKGLIVADTTTDQELQHIRNMIPEEIKVVRLREKLNCLGNHICCNDHVCLVNPNLEDDTIEVIREVLGVPVFRGKIGPEVLVGSYAVMNNQGMITGPNITDEELRELSYVLRVRVIAGTINEGTPAVGSGLVANDWIHISGTNSTNVEIKVIESVLDFPEERISGDIIADEIVV